MLGGVVEHGTQVLEIDQEQLLVIGDAEHDVQHALLHLGELKQARKHGGTHVGHRDANRNPLLAEHIPQPDRTARIAPALDAEASDALLHILGILSRLAHTGYVALDVGHKHGDSGPRKALRHDLERHRLARS